MKTILITGSTDGIGKLTAEKLIEAGHQVIIHGRSEEKLLEVKSGFESKYKSVKLDYFVCDLSDLKAINRQVESFLKSQTKIDVLINNAGVFKSPNRVNKDDLDLRFVVNYLAPIKLTNALLPLLKESSSPRIINLSSAAQSTISYDALSGKTVLSEQEAYAQSKLALTMWSFELAKIESEIVVVALNPGSLLNTKMVQEAYGKHWSSVDKGANILYDLAISDAFLKHSGLYYDNDKGCFAKAHADAYHSNKVDELMKVTENLFGEIL